MTPSVRLSPGAEKVLSTDMLTAEPDTGLVVMV
jgi:hypothetical protein